MLFKIEMPGATELPRVWARISPRVTPRASPRVSPRVTHRVWKPLVFLCFQKKTKHTPQTPLSIQGQHHPYAAYKGSIQGAIQGGNPIFPQPREFAVSNLPTVHLAPQLQNACWPVRAPVLGMPPGLVNRFRSGGRRLAQSWWEKPTQMSPLPKAIASNKQISMGNVFAKCYKNCVKIPDLWPKNLIQGGSLRFGRHRAHEAFAPARCKNSENFTVFLHQFLHNNGAKIVQK